MVLQSVFGWQLFLLLERAPSAFPQHSQGARPFSVPLGFVAGIPFGHFQPPLLSSHSAPRARGCMSTLPLGVTAPLCVTPPLPCCALGASGWMPCALRWLRELPAAWLCCGLFCLVPCPPSDPFWHAPFTWLCEVPWGLLVPSVSLLLNTCSKLQLPDVHTCSLHMCLSWVRFAAAFLTVVLFCLFACWVVSRWSLDAVVFLARC